MTQQTFNDGAALSAARGTINANADDAEARLLALEPAANLYLEKAGGTMSGDLDMGANNIVNVIEISIGADDIPVHKTLGHELTTGVLNGSGKLVANADTTKFDISDGQGYIMDLSDPDLPVFTPVSWSGKIGITPAFAATINSRVYIDANGDVQQQSADFTCQDMRSKIIIGVVTTADTVNVTGFTDESHDVSGSYLTSDLSGFLDVMSSGNAISANGANLSLDRAAGETFQQNINRSVDADCPNIQTDILDSLFTLNRIYSNGAGGFTLEIGETTINPEEYDDGTGTLNTLQNNRFSNQYVYYLANSGLHVVQYGQTEYTTISDAKTEAKLIVPNPLGGLPPAQLRAIITVKKGVTDLATAVSGGTDAFIVQTGKFGFI